MERRIARRHVSRFAQKFTDQELVQIVSAVATHVRPDDPSSVTQVAYDAGRAPAGFEDSPRAYRIAKRFGCSWKEALRLSVLAPNPEQVLGIRSYDRVRNVLTKDEVAHYIQVVAKMLKTDRLSIKEYDESRERLTEDDKRRYLHKQGLSNIMPTSQTIVSQAGSWDEALSWAGLRPRMKESVPPYPCERALDDFIADYGWAPTRGIFAAYQKRRGVRTTAIEPDFRTWRANELDHGLASRHGKVRRLNYTWQAPADWNAKEPTPVPDGYLRLLSKEIDIEFCRADFDKALDFADGQKLTQDLYQRLATTHGLAKVSSIQKVGKQNGGLSWGDLRDEAVARRSRKPREQGRVAGQSAGLRRESGRSAHET